MTLSTCRAPAFLPTRASSQSAADLLGAASSVITRTDRGRRRALELGVDDRVGVGGFVAAGSPATPLSIGVGQLTPYAITCLVASGEFESATTPASPRE